MADGTKTGNLSISEVSSGISEKAQDRNADELNAAGIDGYDSLSTDCLVKDVLDQSGFVLSAERNRYFYKILKTTLDISLAVAGMIVLSPLFLVVALAIKLDSKGKVFYWQKRCGLNGTLFNMIKFRTMVADAERLHQALIPKKSTDGPVFKMADDPRVTKLGRFLRMTSLDEIPQLYNVLKGDMSLVGPRPLAMEEMAENEVWRRIRFMVKPGITGLWQIKGRASNRYVDWIKYDIEYVRNRSLLLDIKILFLTIPAVLRRDGAC